MSRSERALAWPSSFCSTRGVGKCWTSLLCLAADQNQAWQLLLSLQRVALTVGMAFPFSIFFLGTQQNQKMCSDDGLRSPSTATIHSLLFAAPIVLHSKSLQGNCPALSHANARAGRGRDKEDPQRKDRRANHKKGTAAVDTAKAQRPARAFDIPGSELGNTATLTAIWSCHVSSQA